jgi:carboxymethylenebutenolidase
MREMRAEEAAMLETFQQHMAAEMTGDIERTLATMASDPYVNHVPVMTGGVGREGVREFYRNHLVGKFFPPDVELITVSRTVGHNRLVEEVVIRFTHTMPIDWMLPGILPTGKRVGAAVIVIVEFEDGKIASERIYWDQASVLVQLGLIDPTALPVSGAESVDKVLDPRLPSRSI